MAYKQRSGHVYGAHRRDQSGEQYTITRDNVNSVSWSLERRALSVGAEKYFDKHFVKDEFGTAWNGRFASHRFFHFPEFILVPCLSLCPTRAESRRSHVNGEGLSFGRRSKREGVHPTAPSTDYRYSCNLCALIFPLPRNHEILRSRQTSRGHDFREWGSALEFEYGTPEKKKARRSFLLSSCKLPLHWEPGIDQYRFCCIARQSMFSLRPAV